MFSRERNEKGEGKGEKVVYSLRSRKVRECHIRKNLENKVREENY